MFRKHFKRLVNRQYEKNGLNGYIYEFNVDYKDISKPDITKIMEFIHKYFMLKCDIK